MHITHDERITLNQCFNLAHAEMIEFKREPNDDFLKKRTLELLEIFKLTELNIKYKHDYPIRNERGEKFGRT